MHFDYDYFISYAHADNQSEDGKSGFVDEFVRKLKNSPEHRQMFGGDIKVFFDKTEIHNMSDWDNRIRSSLASSRFLIILLSPGYFKSEYCAREFDWWMKHEMHRRMLVEGTTPMTIVDLTNMYNPEESNPEDVRIRLELKSRFPNWFSQIQDYQSDLQFDLHDLDRAKINEALEALRKEAKEKVQRQNDAEKSPNNALYPRYNENFVGRRENLRSLRQYLSEQETSRFAALTGLGGFGKTELALTYGHAFAWDYQLGRVFVNCENQTSLIDILLTSGIAEMHGWELPPETNEQQLEFLFNCLEAKRDEIVRHNAKEGNLKTLGTHILLILDNVDNLDLIKKENLDILPDYFHVIITTRANLNEFTYIHSEPVDRLSEAESVELLSDLRPFGSNESEIAAAHQIAQSLDGFTLVVELTGAYLARNPNVTYQRQYERMVVSHPETFQVMADRTRRLTRHSAETVSAVLESTLLALSDNARKALEFASLMAPDAVGFGWLPELVGLDEGEGKSILDELTGYSLLSPLDNEPNIARIHRLVAETVKHEMPEEKQHGIRDTIREKCNKLLHKDKTFWFASNNSWNITPVSEFCLALAEQWSVETSEQSIDWNLTWMLGASGDILNSLGIINEKRVVFQQCYEISEQRTKSFPDNFSAQRELSVSYSHLGDLENAAGNAAAAREWYEKAMEINTRLADLMPDNVQVQQDLSISYDRLGDLEQALGNIGSARDLFEMNLEICKRLAEQMSDNIQTQRDLSASYERIGYLEEDAGNVAAAREWYEKLLEISKRLADLMPESVDAQRNLSTSYEHLGDMENAAGNAAAALDLYEKALEIRQRLADLMPDNVQIQQHLSYSYERLGDLENAAGNAAAAREWYEKALEIFKQLANLMPDNVQVQQHLSYSYKRLGDLEFSAGNVAVAREWYKKSLEIDQRLADLMLDNVDAQQYLSSSYQRIGILEQTAGNAAAAREWFEKLLEINKRQVDKTPDNVKAQQDLSVSYINLGDLEKDAGYTVAAREWYKKTLEINQQLANLMPYNVEVQRNLSVSYERLGDLEKAAGNATAAREWYEKALKIDQRLADKMPNDVQVQQNLSDLCGKLGDLEKDAGNVTAAREWYKMAREIFKRFADLMPDNFDVQRNLSVSYERLGDMEQVVGNAAAARECYEKALEIRKRFADLMPDNIHTLRYLSIAYSKLGDLEQAVGNAVAAREWCEKSMKIDKLLAEIIPNDVDAQRDLSVSYYKLGYFAQAVGNAAAALEWWEKSLQIFKRLANLMPDNVQAQRDLVMIQQYLTQLQNSYKTSLNQKNQQINSWLNKKSGKS